MEPPTLISPPFFNSVPSSLSQDFAELNLEEFEETFYTSRAEDEEESEAGFNEDRCVEFIRKNPEIKEYFNFDGDTYVHALAKSTKIDVLKTLLSNGFDPNAVNFMGKTPLDKAIDEYWEIKGQRINKEKIIYMMIRELLEHGAKIQSEHAESIINIWIDQLGDDHNNLKNFEDFLNTHNLIPTKENLKYAISNVDQELSDEVVTSIVRQRDREARFPHPRDLSPVYITPFSSVIETFENILMSIKEPEDSDNSAQAYQDKPCRDFIKAHPEIKEKKDGAGNTYLHSVDSRNILKTLLACGFDPNAVNNAGKTPLDLFIDKYWEETEKDENSEEGKYLDCIHTLLKNKATIAYGTKQEENLIKILLDRWFADDNYVDNLKKYLSRYRLNPGNEDFAEDITDFACEIEDEGLRCEAIHIIMVRSNRIKMRSRKEKKMERNSIT